MSMKDEQGIEKLNKLLFYKGVEFELVERRDVIWTTTQRHYSTKRDLNYMNSFQH